MTEKGGFINENLFNIYNENYLANIKLKHCNVPNVQDTLFTTLIITLITTIKHDGQRVTAVLEDKASLNMNS